MATLQTDEVGMRINSFGFALQELMMEDTGTGTGTDFSLKAEFSLFVFIKKCIVCFFLKF